MDGGQGVVAGPGWQESVVPQSSVSGLLVQPVEFITPSRECRWPFFILWPRNLLSGSMKSSAIKSLTVLRQRELNKTL